MATSEINLEEYQEYIERRDNLALGFAKARQMLDEKEAALKIEMDEMFMENIKYNKFRNSEIQQLNNTIE